MNQINIHRFKNADLLFQEETILGRNGQQRL
jgi:hypothetical protein